MDFWSVVGSIFWFMILFAWLLLLFRIFGDLFGDHEMSGWGKALWTVFLIFFPWLGVLVYLIARGRSMNERAMAQAQRNEQAFSEYVPPTSSPSSPTSGSGAPSPTRSSSTPRRSCWAGSPSARSPPRREPGTAAADRGS